MEKSIKINVPEGYEIDEEKSTFKEIVFKKISAILPKTWEDFCKHNPIPKDTYYPCLTGVVKSGDCGSDRSITCKSFGSREDVEAAIALLQLRALRKTWVMDWEPTYNNEISVWYILYAFERITISTTRTMRRALSFPTQEMANDFRKCFKDLIETAKPLL